MKEEHINDSPERDELDPLVIQYLAKSRRWMVAARKKGIHVPQVSQTSTCPPTTSAEIGQHVRRAASDEAMTNQTYLPIRGTDITKGGEGRSLATYYGQALA